MNLLRSACTILLVIVGVGCQTKPESLVQPELQTYEVQGPAPARWRGRNPWSSGRRTRTVRGTLGSHRNGR